MSEIYPPRPLTAAARSFPSLKLIPGMALDIAVCDEEGMPWDFSNAEKRSKADTLIKEE